MLYGLSVHSLSDAMWMKGLNEDTDIHKNIPCIPAGSIVAAQKEDGGLLTYETISGNRTDDHNGRSYKIRVTKTR